MNARKLAKICHRTKTRRWYQELMRKMSCYRCGTNKNITWHHIHPSQKVNKVPRLVRSCGKAKILKEISKCIPLCDNCHKFIHKVTPNLRKIK